MADVRYTPQQLAAINADNPELLVSAAAGSGKTAVLVQRILRLIREKGIDINRMLIVTYTRAAAAEMRERLEIQLSQLAAEDPRMARQLDKLPSAQISTIHSYCQKLIRENFRQAGIDPQFSLCDDRTSTQLYQESLDMVLTSAYEAVQENADLFQLLKVVGEKQLVGIMQQTYQFLLTRADPIGWMKQQAAMEWTMETLERHPLRQALLSRCQLLINIASDLWEAANQLSRHPAFYPKLLQTVAADLDTLSEVRQAIDTGLEATVAKLSKLRFVTIARKPTKEPLSTEEDAIYNEFALLREKYKDIIKDMKKDLPGDLPLCLKDLQHTQPMIRGLCWLMEAFHETFMNVKKERGSLDFNDLEHMALSILSEPELRQNEQSRFDAVFVDEYQDVSAIQETLLNALKREDHSQYFFYVGDVKQSIYRFRQAEPTLFLSKLNHFSDEEDAPQRRIMLNRNFRSREGVLDSVNRVFESIMDERITEIDYNEDAMLYPGNPSVGDPSVELHLCTNAGKKLDLIQMQASVIAEDIQRTVAQPDGNNGDLLHYRDIVILVPVYKGIADKVEAVLTRYGIPVMLETSPSKSAAEEVQQVAQHLLLLDNLRNDLALISELRSPQYDFTESELAEIRLCKPDHSISFLDALTYASQQSENIQLRQRCQTVLSDLEEERFLYRNMPVEEYLWDFLMRSGLYAHYGCQPGGKQRQANLRMLCHQAGEYAKNHTEGLTGFLTTLDSPEDTTAAVANPWQDAVRILTVHKSKGLEFPTVYLMNLNDEIQRRKVTKTVSMHPDIGIGLMYMNAKTRSKRTTLLQAAIDQRTASEARAEKARLLYVAMTRPKNRLVMLGHGSSIADYGEMSEYRAMGLKLFQIHKAKTMLDWVCGVLYPEEWQSLEKGIPTPEGTFEPYQPTFEFSTYQLQNPVENENLPPLSTRFPHKNRVWDLVIHIDQYKSSASRYPQKVNAQAGVNLDIFRNILPTVTETADPLSPIEAKPPVPLKVGVTALCRAIKESRQPDNQQETAQTKRFPLMQRQPRLLSELPEKPEFLTPRKEEEALQRGVCTHLLLSSLDLTRAAKAVADGITYGFVRQSLDELVLSGRMTSEEAKAANLKMVAGYLESPEGRRMLQSPVIKREWSFNLKITEPMDTIVQGVIDLCYLEDDAWVLVDFKTDRVEEADELWERYGLQIDLYKQALEAATPYPVKECGLYALRLGKMVSR